MEEQRKKLPPITDREYLKLDDLIASKDPKLVKRIPKFIKRYLTRILHLNKINNFLFENKDLYNYDLVEKGLRDFISPKITVYGKEKIPATGRYLFAANHPLGGPDGLALFNEVAKVRKDLIFPVNDFLTTIPNFTHILIPINKHGSNASNIRLIDDAFKSENTLLYFPAGLVSRKIKGVIQDLEWKKTFVSKARKFERDIIPVYIDGRNSNFFYNLANLRKFFKMKTNIEMLYLVNELVKQGEKDINIYIGDPIKHSSFVNPREDIEWALKIKKEAYKLGGIELKK